MLTSIAGLPDFLLYLATAVGLTGLYLLVYSLPTARNELTLIRRDVTAAAASSASPCRWRWRSTTRAPCSTA